MNLSKTRNFLYRDRKCGSNCLSHAAQLPVMNGRKRRPTFNSTYPIFVNTKIFGIALEKDYNMI